MKCTFLVREGLVAVICIGEREIVQHLLFIYLPSYCFYMSSHRVLIFLGSSSCKQVVVNVSMLLIFKCDVVLISESMVFH